MQLPPEIFESMTEASADAILITDREGNAVYINPAWEQLTGYTKEEALGKNPRILRSERTPLRVFHDMWKALEAGESFVTEEVVNRRKNGTEYEAHISFFPVMGADRPLYYGSLHRDISERKASDRMRSEFTSVVSHQLNTPLSVINWYAQMLSAGKAGSITPKQGQYLAEIGVSVRRVINLVQALLNVSRVEAGTFSITPEPVSLAGIAEGVLGEHAQKIAAKKLDVERHYDDSLGMIQADSKLTWILFQNIISNAIKYTPEGGAVEIKIEKKDPDALITVSDTGYGIPKVDQQYIFKKMFRARNITHRDVEGNGLGLYIVKETLEAAGGKVWFESPSRYCELKRRGEGCGTTFYATIPLSGMQSKSGTKVIEAGTSA